MRAGLTAIVAGVLAALAAGAYYGYVRQLQRDGFDPRMAYAALEFDLQAPLRGMQSNGVPARLDPGQAFAWCRADEPLGTHQVMNGQAIVQAYIRHRRDAWCPRDAFAGLKQYPRSMLYVAAVPVRVQQGRMRSEPLLAYPDYIPATKRVKVITCRTANSGRRQALVEWLYKPTYDEVQQLAGQGRSDPGMVRLQTYIDRGTLLCPPGSEAS